MCTTIWKFMTLAIITLVIMVGIGGCSDSKAECKVTYDAKEDSFEIILNPPGESGEFTQHNVDGSMKVSTSASKEAGGDFVKFTKYEVNIERKYNESGNAYQIVGSIEFDDSGKKSKLVGYSITITGGVYGDTPHMCTK